ncbi:hypothetical protein LINPERHAP1_LOCUS32061, partial [Linum perenne]
RTHSYTCALPYRELRLLASVTLTPVAEPRFLPSNNVTKDVSKALWISRNQTGINQGVNRFKPRILPKMKELSAKPPVQPGYSRRTQQANQAQARPSQKPFSAKPPAQSSTLSAKPEGRSGQADSKASFAETDPLFSAKLVTYPGQIRFSYKYNRRPKDEEGHN